LVIARDEDSLERESLEADPIRAAVSALLEVLIENTKDGSQARAKAVGAVLEAHERIMDALRAGPTLN
jgi:DNA-binding FadR family transcriptional regulator